MKNLVQNLSGALWGWLRILWIYLVSGWNHRGWRRQIKRASQRGWPDNHQKTVEGSIPLHMKQTLLFIRHGQTQWNVEHRLPGQLPGLLLNDTGRQQAAKLAEILRVLPISMIVSSPLERARDTAEIIAQAHRLQLNFEPALMDTNVGHWAGLNFDELRKQDDGWKAFVKDPTTAPPGVESFTQVQHRSVAAAERWRTREDAGAYVAFVAHGDVVKLLIAHYSGLEAKRAASLFIDNASVSIVELQDDQQPRIVAIGWNPQPGWLKPPAPEAQQTKEEGQPVEKQKA